MRVSAQRRSQRSRYAWASSSRSKRRPRSGVFCAWPTAASTLPFRSGDDAVVGQHVAVERIELGVVDVGPPAETRYLEREEIAQLFPPTAVRRPLRPPRPCSLAAALQHRRSRVDLQGQPSVRLHGKGDKWRSCPLWSQTAQLLRDVLQTRLPQPSAMMPVFVSRGERALTRFGIYKIVRRHTRHLDDSPPTLAPRRPRRTPGEPLHGHEPASTITAVCAGWLRSPAVRARAWS